MEIIKDRFVVIEYTLRLEDGSYVKGEEGPVSLNFVAGYNQLLPALEQKLLGLEEGVETEFVIPAQEGFGEYDSDQVKAKTFAEFPEGAQLPLRKWIIATNSQTQTQYAYFVKNKTDKEVILDFNHPLAGKDLYYKVKIVKVRQALKDELEYLRPCESEENPSPATATLS